MTKRLTYNFAKRGFLWTTAQYPPFPVVLTTGKSCCCCACCKIEGEDKTYTCTDDVPQAECLAGGGEKKCECPTPAEPSNRCTCEDEPCCNGACCTDEGCEVTADVVCAEREGDFKGCGTTCEEYPCCGACDESNPCPEGCTCVNGQCADCSVIDSCPGSALEICVSISGGGAQVSFPPHPIFGCERESFPLFGGGLPPNANGANFSNPLTQTLYWDGGKWSFVSNTWPAFTDITLERQCAQWSVSGAIQTAVFLLIVPEIFFYEMVLVSGTFSVNCGDVQGGACGPESGLSCEGTLYWSAQYCVVNGSYQSTVSGSTPITITVSSGACA